ncbi:hypothetical protein F5880DRAFT_1510275 [Lentinula raphanica]|nr:hypothetical protein F5880DRAFT_1510275 [Lentinula raphanica]
MISETSKTLMDKKFRESIKARVKQVSGDWADSEESQGNPDLIERVVWWWDQLANNGRLSKNSKADYDYNTHGTAVYEDYCLLHNVEGATRVPKKLKAGSSESVGNIGEASNEIVMPGGPGLANGMSEEEELEAMVSKITQKLNMIETEGIAKPVGVCLAPLWLVAIQLHWQVHELTVFKFFISFGYT